MVAALALETRPAFPLGKPLDGRERYGMTPEQARIYHWLVRSKPHDRSFIINFRELSRVRLTALSNMHARVEDLIERGWIEKHGIIPVGGLSMYRFVHPVMLFCAPR